MLPDRSATVVVVDDDVSVLKALKRQINLMGYDVEVFDEPEQALVSLKAGVGDCLLVDLNMPRMNGLELQAAICAAGRSLPVVFLSAEGTVRSTVDALRGGAEDFLEKPVEYDALSLALDKGLARAAQMALEAAEIRQIRQRMETLTDRQNDVLLEVLTGMPNKVIAFKLGISERTVKAHRFQIMEKLEAASLADLCFMAAKVGRSSSPET